MYGSCVINPETRPQLVPSHGSGDAGSPLSLEHWYVSDLDAWLRDSEVPSQELTKPSLSIHQRQQMNTRLVSNLPTYGNSSAEPNVHVRDSTSKLTGSVTSYQHSVHVNIPSPVSSFNTVPAESPTLYDSVLPTSNLTKDSNTYSSIPYLPIPVHEIKHELPDNYNCNNDDLLSASGFLRNLIKTEEEVTCSYQLSQEKFQQVQYLAMEQVSHDIDQACQVLGISRDPVNWSVQDVRAWFRWTLKQYNLPSVLLDNFSMNGVSLCSMTEEDFHSRASEDGATLFAQLDIWKIAANMRKNCQSVSASPFRVEDSVLDMNALINHWSSNSVSAVNTSSTHTNQVNTMGNDMQTGLIPASAGSGCGTGAFNNSFILGTEELPVLASRKFTNDNLHSDDETSEDGCDVDRSGGDTRSGPHSHTRPHSHIHLWQFLKELLSQPQMYGSCIRWLDRSKSIFKIEDSVRVARFWGRRKNRPAMNYDKLSRSIRQYYKKGIMKKTERSQRLVYQFCPPYGL